MSINITETNVWPVNELGEIVFEAGAGTNNVVGYLNSSFIPTTISGKKVPVKVPGTTVSGISDVPGLTAALAAKQNTLTGTGDVPGLTAALAAKQNTLTGTGDVPGLVSALNAKQNTLTAPSDVPGLTAALALKGDVPLRITATEPVTLGSTLTATFSAGWSAASVQWTRNGSNISGATSTTYVFTTDDSGQALGVVPTGLRYTPTATYTIPSIGDSGSFFPFATTTTGVID